MNLDAMKKLSAEVALDSLVDGMRIGLGTGSTMGYFIEGLGARISEGRLQDIIAVPSSENTALLAKRVCIPLSDLNSLHSLDITVDGADEIDDDLNLIKGGGGALWREKILAMASDTMMVIVDSSKYVKRLGLFPLAVEVSPFGSIASAEKIAAICGVDPVLRGGDVMFISDSGNYIYDCSLGSIEDIELLARALESVAGLIAHGLFIGYADRAIIGTPTGIKILERSHKDG